MYKKQKIHFVGIGGIGMSGIAEVLINLGYPISGSDLKRTDITRRLKKKGAAVFYGHARGHVEGANVVVMSSAVKKDNPEVLEARARHIPLIQRAEMLAQLMRFSRYGIAVAGTHGKTTTTSLIGFMLTHAGFDPTVIIGGRVNNFKSNARLGKGEFMVAEADESDGSFLKLAPTMEIITTIDREHMDYYGTFDAMKEAYLEFTRKLPFYGVVVACLDHPEIAGLLPHVDKKVLTYGFGKGAAIRADHVAFEGRTASYDLIVHGKKQACINLNLMGRHNILNSLACIAIGLELDVPLKKIQRALKEFKGIGRRCELLLQKGVTVIDDYGHHPEEIRETLTAIRGAYQGRLVTLFQPHRYSRTQDLFDDFVSSFDKTHVLLVTDIYPAGEAPIRNVDAKSLAAAIGKRNGLEVHYIPRHAKIVDDVIKHVKPGDVLLSLGAGDVTRLGRECAKRLRNGGT